MNGWARLSGRRLFSPLPFAAFLSFLLLQPGLAGAEQRRKPEVVAARHGMVVSVSEPASAAGVEMLKQGGNAVDAAVATALALAVTFPEAGNLGGGGFMMVKPPGQTPVCVEYRETAPAAATPTMFELGETRFGPKVAGTPGTVAGLALAHKRFGKLPWKVVCQPAIKLARDGFEVSPGLVARLNPVLRDPQTKPFTEMLRVYAPPRESGWEAGDKLTQPDLAKTLTLIADEGPAAFYRGPIADQIVATMKAGGGLVTHADLAAYHANIRPAIHGVYRGFDVYGPPPPSSGGIALVEMLNILENFDLKGSGRWSPLTLHLMVEAMRRAFLDRARYVGDNDFVEVPIGKLTSKQHAKKWAQSIDQHKATSSESLSQDIPLAPESNDTTHFSVIDKDGMAVSNTYTLEFSYGCRVVVKGAGFLLNNEMGDFNWKPGHTDRHGNIGTPPNVIAPGKRMVSSQTPAIVARDGQVVLVTGSPGGRTIINTTLAMVLNTIEFEMSPAAAMAAPRLHHQWFPDVVRFEGVEVPEHSETLKELEAWGHEIVREARRQGDAHSIWVDRAAHMYLGVADPRIDGSAQGY